MILGSRGSPLALAQSRWVRDRLLEAHEGLSIELKLISTTGDHHQAAMGDAPLDLSVAGEGKGIFVREIEEALRDGAIDLAVHSLKDLPTEQPGGLAISAIPVREDPRDVIVSKNGHPLEQLPAGASIGTGSPRRACQISAARPDLVIVPVRGNVGTRVRKMMEGSYDASILAAAGLSRLGALDPGPRGDRELFLAGMVSYLPEEVCLPAVGQGALAIETRVDDEETRRLVAVLDDAASNAEVKCERSFLAALGGGCRTPIAALARAKGDHIELRGMVASRHGRRVIRVGGEGSLAAGVELGRRVAEEALAAGARSLLDGSAW